MDSHEFELRYLSFLGLKEKLNLDWSQEYLLELVKITNKGQLLASVPETSPEDLKTFTLATYTPTKKQLIQESQNTFPLQSSEFSLAAYVERLEYELKVIREMGFNSYFLIVGDYVRWAKRNGIVVGPGRGSGAGSLLARCVEITDIDPLPFGLLFERFLNPARISMPDFDIDFEDTQRQRVIDYCTEKYGKEKVCAIGTFMKMATKAAFKDASRAIGIPFDKANLVSNLLPNGVKLQQMIDNIGEYEQLEPHYNSDAKIQEAFKLAAGLEGNMRQLGMHACGVIIAPNPVDTYTPIQYVKETDQNLVTQYDGPLLERIGLLKMDFLGLRNLSIIRNCIRIIKARHDKAGERLPEIFSKFGETSSFLPPINDPYPYEKVFKSGDTTGIFQFESAGMRKFLIQLEPESINDLVAMNALYRPGPMEFIPRYIDRKHGREQISYMEDELRDVLNKKYGAEIAEEENQKLIQDLGPIMGVTYGIPVYQEQLMFLVQAMAGFSLGEADMLRRGVGKKKKEVIEEIKKDFVTKGASFRNYKPETTNYIYEKMIEPAASYSFNKSHSVCYSMIAYQTAYLKAYYPVEFSAALIRSVEADVETQSFYISEIQNRGINVLNPDINQSFNHVAAIDSEIRLGFFSVKGVGAEIGEVIQQERKAQGNYQSLEDFLKRCSAIINKKSLESLIKCGALDQFADRKILLENSNQLIDRSKNISQSDFGLFGGEDLNTDIQLKETTPSTLIERLEMEQEVLKSFVSGNPLDGLYPYIKRYSFLSQLKEDAPLASFRVIAYITEIQRARRSGFFIKLEDISGKWEFFIKNPLDLKKFDLVIIHGAKNARVYINKIVKTSYEALQKMAGSSFDPSWTVARAKKERYGELIIQEIEKIKEEKVDLSNIKITIKPDITQEEEEQDPSAEGIIEEEMIDEPNGEEELNDDSMTGSFAEEELENISENIVQEDTTSKGLEIATTAANNNGGSEDETNSPQNVATTAENPEINPGEMMLKVQELPNEIHKIHKLIATIAQYPGEIEVSIVGQKKYLSAEGIEIIKELLK